MRAGHGRKPRELCYARAVSDPAPPAVATDPAVPRPGPLRRAAAGAWHVAAGFGFLLRRPRLWPLALLPAFLTLVSLVAGLLLALYSIHWFEQVLVPGPDRIPVAVGFVLTLLVWFAVLSSGLVLGLAVALLLSAPALEALSRRVDAMVRGEPASLPRGLGWELVQSFKGTLYFLAAAPGVFLLSLVPVVGPVLAALWGAWALSFQETDAALTRRGLAFAARRAWHRTWRPESLGFGLAGLVALLVPFANLLVTPALAVGGTLLVLELEDELVPPDRRP